MRSQWSGYDVPPLNSFVSIKEESTGAEAEVVDIPDSAVSGRNNVFFKVCAVNTAGRNCSQVVPAKPLPRALMEARNAGSQIGSRVPIGEPGQPDRPMMFTHSAGLASAASNDVSTIIPPDPIRPSDKVVIPPDPIRPEMRGITLSNVVATFAACKSGYVWREANASDHVCVTPESRSTAAQENAVAEDRRDPNGAYGPNTCVSGFVWREAASADLVCVTPERRSAVRAENGAAAHRTQ